LNLGAAHNPAEPAAQDQDDEHERTQAQSNAGAPPPALRRERLKHRGALQAISQGAIVAISRS
jgi:hypothetical protein